MGLFSSVRRWLVDDIDEEGVPAASDPADSDEKTTIDDAKATSLRAIKLPDPEREALDAEEREP